jgi:hypothetical protein
MVPLTIFIIFAEVYTYLEYLSRKPTMSKLPTTENTEIFTMRISKKLKLKLNELAKRSKYGGSASSAIRVLIESASKR